jgi:hypothetical protein
LGDPFGELELFAACQNEHPVPTAFVDMSLQPREQFGNALDFVDDRPVTCPGKETARIGRRGFTESGRSRLKYGRSGKSVRQSVVFPDCRGPVRVTTG